MNSKLRVESKPFSFQPLLFLLVLTGIHIHPLPCLSKHSPGRIVPSLSDDCALPYVTLGYSRCCRHGWCPFHSPSPYPGSGLQRVPRWPGASCLSPPKDILWLQEWLALCSRELAHQEQTPTPGATSLPVSETIGVILHTVCHRVPGRTELQLPRVTSSLPHMLPGLTSLLNYLHPHLLRHRAIVPAPPVMAQQ